MQIKSYRARSVQEALALVRADLGPDAAVLHTREVAAGGKWFGGARQIEVIATPDADNVPSRLPSSAAPPSPAAIDRFRAQLAEIADQGVDLQDTTAPSLEVPAAAHPDDWPAEVATRFWEMLNALPPHQRRQVVDAFAEAARANQQPRALSHEL